MCLKFTLLCLLAHASHSIAASKESHKEQSVTVTGDLCCGSSKVTDEDTWVKITSDNKGFDDQTEAPINANGSFHITLTAERPFDLKPKLYIYTSCNYRTIYGAARKGCYRRLEIEIPKKYVHEGEASELAYDLGKYDLSKKSKDEEKKCNTSVPARG